MRSDQGGYSAIDIPAHRDLLAGHLGMEVDKSYFNVAGQRSEEFIGLPERTVGVRHIHTSLEIHHSATPAVAHLVDIDACAGTARRVICGPQKTRVAVEIFVNVALVPDVITGSHHVDAAAEQVVRDGRRDAESGGGIFSVRDHHVDRLGLPDVRKMIGDDTSSRASEDVANEKKPHPCESTSVIIISNAHRDRFRRHIYRLCSA